MGVDTMREPASALGGELLKILGGIGAEPHGQDSTLHVTWRVIDNIRLLGVGQV